MCKSITIKHAKTMITGSVSMALLAAIHTNADNPSMQEM